MKLRTLTGRSLRFHWRSHLGVVIGAAIGSAALIGALIVGDSVKGSLRERALERLGGFDWALSANDRFLSSNMVAKLSQTPFWEPVLQLDGVLSRQDGAARASHVQLFSILPTFWAYSPNGEKAFQLEIVSEARSDEHQRLRAAMAWMREKLNFTNLPTASAMASFHKSLGREREQFGRFSDFYNAPQPPVATNDLSQPIFLNEPLAERLNVKVGEAVLFRMPKPHALSSDAVMVSRNSDFVTMRFQVADIVYPGNFGLLDLLPGRAAPLNAFVAPNAMPDAFSLRSKANVVLVDTHHASSEIHPGDFLTNAWCLTDIQARLLPRDSGRNVELQSERVFLDPPLIRSALAADTNAHPLLTYLANLITVGTNAASYSMVTAAGAPWTPAGLRDDEIVLNQWLADDLQAKPGDVLTLVYFDPESGARLTERTNTFRVHSIVPMQMPWADRTLMPQFPGIEKAETTAEWDTAFPLVHKIRPQDDDYWTDWRGTPKAFVTLAAGQKMWANRFGNLTAIRFPIPTNDVAQASQPAGSGGIPAASSEHRAGMPGEPAAKDGRATAENFRAALEKKILATLKPEELGLRFEPVREQALKAAEQSQDFGGLFIGFSLFVIVAALLLMAMLFQFSLEQRAAEIGTLLALGFTPKQVRRLFLREGAALAFVGGLIGTLGGIGYARAMLLGLSTLWRDAVGASSLKFFVTPQTLLIGLFASTLVAAVTLWFALRKQAKQPAWVLLAGALECGNSSPAAARQVAPQKGSAKPQHSKVGWLSFIAALGLAGWTLAKGDTANAGAFFGAGALVLIAGLAFVNSRLAKVGRVTPCAPLLEALDDGAHGVTRPTNPNELAAPSIATLAFRGLTRRRSRSVATVAMLASGTFLIVSIGVFRLDANRDATKRSSGTGGFALIGESTMPVVADLNTKAGRETFALNEADFADVNFVQFRVRAGDEASCLNLNRAQKPRLLGVKPNSLIGRFSFGRGAGEAWGELTKRRWFKDPEIPLLMDEVAAIGDAASIQWAMGKKVGETLDYVDERGRPFKVRIVGAVANSILQGQLIIDEAEFVKRFPSESGYKVFLVDAPTNRVPDISAKLSRALQDVGLEMTPAPQRLAQFNAVQNTYLGTFQILGGLGLLLGSAGLGIVVLRNVLERRAELAVLLAIGWRRSAVNQLVLREHLALLGLGLAVGLVAAVVAVLPALLTPGAAFPWFTLSLTLAAVLANGVVWTWLAARVALRGELLAALRNE